MRYITCDEYDGKNTPNRTLDLKSAFQEVGKVLVATWPRTMRLRSVCIKPFITRTYCKAKVYVSDKHKIFQIKETPTYAPFFIPEDDSMNGRSYMEFSTDLTAVTVKDGASIGSRSLGSWKAGLSNPLSLTDPENMSDYSAQLVFRVVTIEVRG